MKELENQQPDKLNVAQVLPAKRTVFNGTMPVPQPGQTLYQLDMSTAKITEAVYEKGDTFDPNRGEVGTVIKRVRVQPNCIYAAAINIKNAKKKFIKMVQNRNDNQIKAR